MPPVWEVADIGLLKLAAYDFDKHVVIAWKFMHIKNLSDIWTLSMIFSMIENGLKLQKSDSNSSNKYMKHYFSFPKFKFAENSISIRSNFLSLNFDLSNENSTKIKHVFLSQNIKI